MLPYGYVLDQETPLDFIIAQSQLEAVQFLKKEVEKWANQSITRNGVFRIAVDGCSTIKHVCDMLLDPRQNTDLTKWKIFLCDERYVPETDENSNFGQYKARLNVPNSPIRLEQIFSINTELPIKKAAKDYENRIRTEFGVTADEIPKFDCIILGIGTDGHTCSLFPGHKLLDQTKKLVSRLTDAPIPPPERITMTLPLLNNTKALCVIVTGLDKHPAVMRYVMGDMSFPIARVNSPNTIRIFDKEAGYIASKIITATRVPTNLELIPGAPPLAVAFEEVLRKTTEANQGIPVRREYSESSSETSTPIDSSEGRTPDDAPMEEESDNPQPSTSAAAVKKVGNKETDKSETSSTSTAADKGIEDNPESSSTSTVAKGPEDNPQSVSSISSEAKATEEKNDSSSSDDE